jgi:hypothetical protein
MAMIISAAGVGDTPHVALAITPALAVVAESDDEPVHKPVERRVLS